MGRACRKGLGGHGKDTAFGQPQKRACGMQLASTELVICMWRLWSMGGIWDMGEEGEGLSEGCEAPW